jgi:hypothetical protein
VPIDGAIEIGNERSPFNGKVREVLKAWRTMCCRLASTGFAVSIYGFYNNGLWGVGRNRKSRSSKMLSGLTLA